MRIAKIKRKCKYVLDFKFQRNYNYDFLRSYPFCAVSDYPPNTQPYYATTGNYTAATNTPSHSSSLPYIVPVDDNLLVPSSQSRDSPQSLTAVSKRSV